MKSSIITLIVLIFHTFTVANELKFETLPSNEHIASKRILKVFRDSEGYLWLCAADGVSRCDNYLVSNYNNNDTTHCYIKGSRFFSIFETLQNDLVIGSNAGLNIYNKKTDSFDYIHFPDSIERRILLIESKGTNKLLVHSPTETFLFNTNSRTFKKHSFRRFIRCTVSDKQKNKWYGTSTGTILNESGDINIKVEGNINDLCFTPSGNLFVSTNRGLFVIEYTELFKNTPNIIKLNSESESLSLSNSFIYCLEYYKKSIWVGSRIGLNEVVLDPKTELPIKVNQHYHNASNIYSIANNEITDLLVDTENILWITSYGGVNKLDQSHQWFSALQHEHTNSNSLLDNNILSLEKRPDNKIWVGYLNNGMSLYDPSKNTLTHYLSDNYTPNLEHVNHIYTNKKGNAWIVTQTEIFLYSKEQDKIIHIQPVLENNKKAKEIKSRKIFEDSYGTTWVGSNKGLYTLVQLKNNNYKLKPIENIPPNEITSFYEDPHRRLWIGTNSGFILTNNEQLKTQNEIKLHNAIKNLRINDIKNDSYGNIWIATNDGLYYLNKAQVDQTDISSLNLKKIDQSNGIANNYINGIIPISNGKIWFSTQKGVCSYVPSSDAGRFYNYTNMDGLVGEKYNLNAFLYNNETLYFGCINGINYLKPNISKVLKHKSSIYINRLTINGQTIFPSKTKNNYIVDFKHPDTLEIVYNKNISSMNVKLHTSSLLSPQQQFLKWKLGKSGTWQSLDHPEIIIPEFNKQNQLIIIQGYDTNGNPTPTKYIKLKSIEKSKISITIIVLVFLGVLTIFTILRMRIKKESLNKYRFSGISAHNSEKIFTNLEELMKNDKPYLNTKLSAQDLAQSLNITTTALSQVLNKYRNIGFYEYINKYRVEEFTIKIKSDALHKHTLLAISEECGFSSKTSFYRVLKKETGMTPSEYVKKNVT